MMPNNRWDDFAIDQFVQSVRDYMQATSTLPNQMVKLSTRVEENTRRINSHHEWIETVETRMEQRIGEVKNLCERIGEELRSDTKARMERHVEEIKERKRARVAVIVAIIGSAGVIAAAVASAILASAPH